MCPICGEGDGFFILMKGAEETESIGFDEDGEIWYGEIETFFDNAYVSHIGCECGHIFTTQGGKAITTTEELKKCFDEGSLDVDTS
jgi:hypothetical protein